MQTLSQNNYLKKLSPKKKTGDKQTAMIKVIKIANKNFFIISLNTFLEQHDYLCFPLPEQYQHHQQQQISSHRHNMW